jgi:hypothetical protein
METDASRSPGYVDTRTLQPRPGGRRMPPDAPLFGSRRE